MLITYFSISAGIYARANSMEERNKKVTWNILVLCLCYFICTIPHLVHGYFSDTRDHTEDNWYDVLLGVYWLQYGFNIVLYVLQRDQYWNAYKFYFRGEIRPMFKKTPRDSRPSSSDITSAHYVKTPNPSSRNYFFYNF